MNEVLIWNKGSRQHEDAWIKKMGLEQLVKFFQRVTLQKLFDKTMKTSSTVTAYLANPCVKTEMQVKLALCQMGIQGQSMKPVTAQISKEQ